MSTHSAWRGRAHRDSRYGSDGGDYRADEPDVTGYDVEVEPNGQEMRGY